MRWPIQLLPTVSWDKELKIINEMSMLIPHQWNVNCQYRSCSQLALRQAIQSSPRTCNMHFTARRKAKICKRCIYATANPYVCLSVRHAPVLIVSKRGNAEGYGLYGGLSGVSSFLTPRMVVGGTTLPGKIWVQRRRPLRKQLSCTHLAS